MGDNWSDVFGAGSVYIEGPERTDNLHHYVFFTRDHTFECLALGFTLRRATQL